MVYRPTLQALLTRQGTRVFVDVENAELRHAHLDFSPDNLFLRQHQGVGFLVYAGPDGSLNELEVALGDRHSVVRFRDPASGTPRRWGVAPGGAGRLSLSRDRLFLCAEPDGSVTLSLPHPELWLDFSAADIPPGPCLEKRAPGAWAEALIKAAQPSGRVDANGVLLDLSTGGDTLAIYCAGLVPNRVMYAMENSSQAIATQKLFLCDRTSLIYYTGIGTLTESFEATIELVGAVIDRLRPAATCAIGTSGGGYMALALTARLGLDRALAFSPTTSLDAAWQATYGEDRWPAIMSKIQSVTAPNPPHDVVDMIRHGGAARQRAKSRYFVLYPARNRLDRLHAERLLGLPGVETIGLDSDDHNISAELRSRLRLGPLIAAFFQPGEAQLGESLRRLATLSDRPP